MAYDADRDLAVLDVPGLDAAALPRAEELTRGEAAVVAGFPLDGPYDLEPGRVREVLQAQGRDIYDTADVVREVYSVYAEVQPGNSGGPLLTEDGEVAGVVFAKSLDDENTGIDALHALAERLKTAHGDDWPDTLLFVGDQVYADDNISPVTKAFVDSRRPREDAPDGEINDFEEYTKLYQESWSQAPIRWLLSTVPSAMIFDDHDVRDDWNTSQDWRQEMEATSWWHGRIVAALGSYWVHQHLGNLSVAERAEDLRGHAVEEGAVVADDQHGAVIGGQHVLEAVEGVHVEVVGRFVEDEEVGRLRQRHGEREPVLLAA